MVSVLAVIVTGSPGLGLRVFQIRRHGVQIIFSHVLRTVLNHFGHCTKGSGDVSAIRFKEIHQLGSAPDSQTVMLATPAFGTPAIDHSTA